MPLNSPQIHLLQTTSSLLATLQIHTHFSYKPTTHQPPTPLTTMDAAAAANVAANANPENTLSWLAVTTLVVVGMFLGHRALCRHIISVDEATNLLRAAQNTITVTRYNPTTVFQAPTRTITRTTATTATKSWSEIVHLSPQFRVLAAAVPWKLMAHVVVVYLVFVFMCLGSAWWLRMKAANLDRRLAAVRRLHLDRIRKRPEGLGSWSVSTDDILDLPY